MEKYIHIKNRNGLILQVNPRLFINQAQDYFLVLTYHILIRMVILMAQGALN